jgi:hypothetical protein
VYGKTATLPVLLFSLFCLAPVCAQISTAAHAGENDKSFTQRLTWDAAANVYKYEVTIEREDGAVVERQITTENNIELSLPPGRYRYTVAVYNLLDLIEYRMPVVAFEVIEALQPRVTSWDPKVFTIGVNNEVTFLGTNLVDGAQFYIVKPGSPEKRVNPISVRSLGNGASALVTLPVEELEKGSWTLHVINPGGLSTEASGFAIMNKPKKLDFDLAALYSPALPVMPALGLPLETSGYVFTTVVTDAYYHGAELKAAWLANRENLVTFGLALEAFWTNFNTELDQASVFLQMVGVNASLLLQFMPETGRFAVALMAGGGARNLLDFHIEPALIEEEAQNLYMTPFLRAGLSFKLYPTRSFFIEFGASLHITFPLESPDLLYFNPQAGLGYSF